MLQLHRSGVFALRGADNPHSPGYTSYRTSKRLYMFYFFTSIVTSTAKLLSC